ncbi:hypothetical protein U1Q18_008355 [Sarracenia purpurea var. burkii]
MGPMVEVAVHDGEGMYTVEEVAVVGSSSRSGETTSKTRSWRSATEDTVGRNRRREVSAKKSTDLLGLNQARISVRVSDKGSPSPAQLAISGKEGGAAGCGFDRKLQRIACIGKKKGRSSLLPKKPSNFLVFNLRSLYQFPIEPEKNSVRSISFPMAKTAGSSKKSWIEVAPAPLIPHTKASNSPGLETIAEEVSDDSDQDL